MSDDPRRLSALIVNYNSGAFAVRCVESLLDEWRREGRDPRGIEVVLIDNASPQDQEPFLRRIEELATDETSVEVIRCPDNLGYAAGMNRCLERTSGGPDDVVAALNPDLFFLPGNIRTLMDYLAEHPECGVVAPRATIDPEFRLSLPKNPLPTPVEELRVLGAQISPALCRAYSRRRFDYSLPWWTSDQPLATDMLSGCCLFLRRSVVDDLGGVMDERYPLYYEDTDLFRSLDERGLTVVQHTGTTIVHHWSRSSGFGESFLGEPMRRYQLSRAAYFRKFYGPIGLGVIRLVDWLAAKWPAKFSHRAMHPMESLGEVADPPELPMGRSTRFLLEVALRPNWQLAVGIAAEGDRWVCPADAWTWFFDVDYFVRAVERDTGEVLGAWHFRKTTPGRTEPLSDAEIAALRAAHDDELEAVS
ncbi:MAG: glycosyltransferase family 2 protein [Planctomycetota bacterium]